jgi:hypothetical protein
VTRRIVRALGALLLAIFAFFAMAPPGGAVVPATHVAKHGYNASSPDWPVVHVHVERGPPTTHRHPSYDAGGHRSRGASARLGVATSGPTTTYTIHAEFVRVAESATTTQGPGRVLGADLSSLTGPSAAAEAPLAQTSRTVSSIAERAGVGLDGVKVHILDPTADADTIRYLDLQGAIARTDELGIQLHPNAFANEETLVKTLAHERTHVYQIETFSAYGTGHVGDFEDAAYAIEDSIWQYFLGGGSR